MCSSTHWKAAKLDDLCSAKGRVLLSEMCPVRWFFKLIAILNFLPFPIR